MRETGFLNRTLTASGESFRYQVYLPAEWTPDRRWPTLLFLHGAGEGGSDGLLQTQVGLGPAIRRHPDRFPTIVVFPQSRRGQPWRGRMADLALEALDRALEEHHGDPRRVYLTGVSMGGYGTWRFGLEDPSRFAALVPVCGGLEAARHRLMPENRRDPLADPFLEAARRVRHVPIWIFHGEEDPIIPVSESRVMVEALRRVGGNVRYTEFAGVEHDSWDPAYAEPELMPWLLSHQTAGQEVPR